MNSTATLRGILRNSSAFAACAEVYDKHDNPLLLLESRYFERMLPNITGKHVLDIGCGTGRCIEELLSRGRPASICGLDASQEMLRVATEKKLPGVALIHAELPSIPVPSESMDIVSASFVLSYVDDIQNTAIELSRVVREGGDLFITDMHPRTASQLGWNRSFQHEGNDYVLDSGQLSICEIAGVMSRYGFMLVASYEPSFGENEFELFHKYGKDDAWLRAVGSPAIYLLHFRRSHQFDGHLTDALRLRGARCAIGPSELVAADLTIDKDCISSITSISSTSTTQEEDANTINLEGYLVFPGLVNAHDHLEFALFPRLGSPPYRNATEWAVDIQSREAATIALHRQVPKDIRLWWGGIRNLLCGVTTVCHHNLPNPLLQHSDFPVHVLSRYGWAHSVTFERDIPLALKRTEIDEPFIIHACEGIDQDAADDLKTLDSLNAIEDRTILIHGLALDDADFEMLNQRGASLVICPSSNSFLFGRNHTREQLRIVRRLACGSDSPITAAGDLLDELRFTKQTVQLEARDLYGLVTDQSAKILRLRKGEGTLCPKGPADLFAVRSDDTIPADVLTSLNWRDVELVVVGGRVRLASSKIFDRLPVHCQQGLSPLIVEGILRWLAAPIPRLLREAIEVLGHGNVRVGGLRVSVPEI